MESTKFAVSYVRVQSKVSESSLGLNPALGTAHWTIIESLTVSQEESNFPTKKEVQVKTGEQNEHIKKRKQASS